MKQIELENTILRRPIKEDFDKLYQIFGDPVVMRHWVGGPDKTPDETKKRIDEIDHHWEIHGFGDFVVIEKKTERLIGYCGLHYIDDLNDINIGYAFKRSYWRRGLAFEVCQRIIKYAFERLYLSHIVAVIWPDNMPSINLAKKCGMTFWKSTFWGGGDRVIYILRNNSAEPDL